MRATLADHGSAAPTTAAEWGGPRGGRWFPWILVGFVLVAIVSWIVFVGFGLGQYRPAMGGPGVFWPLFPAAIFLFFLLLVAVGRWGWRGSARGCGYTPRGYASAHEVLRERHARGEITREQLHEMSRTLDETA
ncbi:MAG: SHOCT domain-containing protein [Thermoplasmata archaeon]